jgi:flagellar basal-body rod protein FlgF
MDRLIYTAMSGAKQVFLQQAGVAQNLANAATTGYRAMEHRFRAVPVLGAGQPTRAFAADASVANVFEQGPLMTTGRPLDVALSRAPAGSPCRRPTAARPTPVPATSRPMPTVCCRPAPASTSLGEGGPISLPPDNNIAIAADGTVSSIPALRRRSDQQRVNVVGRIKLVNPPENDLVRGDDGLFRTRNGVAAVADENVKLAPRRSREQRQLG